VYSGLAGPLLIYKKGILNSKTGLPTDVDKEFILLYQVRTLYALHNNSVATIISCAVVYSVSHMFVL
jgi:hypothetical protein